MNMRVCYLMILFLRRMLEYNIRISDIYYKNFGSYRNKLVLFDYHEVDSFTGTPSNFLITNLYTNFTQLGHELHWSVKEASLFHWNDVVSDSFGQKSFPVQFYQLLAGINNNSPDLPKLADELLSYITHHLKADLVCVRVYILRPMD